MALPILVHANLEHPLGYLYFLGLLGLHGRSGPRSDTPSVATESALPRAMLRELVSLRLARSSLAAVGWPMCSSCRSSARRNPWQRAGLDARRDAAADARARGASRGRAQDWSPYADYAETHRADRGACRPSPTPPISPIAASRLCSPSVLLRTCSPAAPPILLVAGQAQRASYFANSLCKIYPGVGAGADPVDDVLRADEPGGSRT